jgi:hypothetical protein
MRSDRRSDRRFCTQRAIFTNFDPKGRPLKDRQQLKEQQRLKEALNRAANRQDRATRLEGSFGNHKNHYGLNKVKARTQTNEIVWIYRAAAASVSSPLMPYRSPTNAQNNTAKRLIGSNRPLEFTIGGLPASAVRFNRSSLSLRQGKTK